MKITDTTILSSQEKQALFDKITAGQKETFKMRFSEVFFDPRTFAMVDPITKQTIPASGDMLAIIEQNDNKQFSFTPKLNDIIETAQIDVSGVYRRGAPMKAIKRFNQFMRAVYSKDLNSIDLTSAVILLALDLAGDKGLTNDALLYLGTGANDDAGMGANTRGVARSTIRAKLSQVGRSTMPTQISRSVGKSGFLTVCGAVTEKQKGVFILNRNHPMICAFLELIGNATPGAIDLMFSKLKAK